MDRAPVMAVSRSGQVMLGLAMMTGLWVTIVSLHLSSNSEAERHHNLLQRAEYERTDAQRAQWMRQRAVGAGAGPAASQLYLDVNGNPVSIDNSPPDAGAGAREETPSKTAGTMSISRRIHFPGVRRITRSPSTLCITPESP
jgi:hypothetical protein